MMSINDEHDDGHDGLVGGAGETLTSLLLLCGNYYPWSAAKVAVDETVILLRPPLPLAGVSIGMERERQKNDSHVNGYAKGRLIVKLLDSPDGGGFENTCSAQQPSPLKRSESSSRPCPTATSCVLPDASPRCDSLGRCTADKNAFVCSVAAAVVDRPDGRGLTPLMALFEAEPSPFDSTDEEAVGGRSALVGAVLALGSAVADPGRRGAGRTAMEWAAVDDRADIGRQALLELPGFNPSA